MKVAFRLPAPQLPRESRVALVSLEQLHGFQPEDYVALVHAVGSTADEALHELERQAVEGAQANHAEAVSRHEPPVGIYVVLGLRLAAGTAADGQPTWPAYGTLTRGHRSYSLSAAHRVDGESRPGR